MDQIVVPASPASAQVEAGIRQIILWLAGVLGAWGMSGAAGQLNGVLAFAGPIAAIVVFVWGQLHTRSQAKKLAVTAAAAPNNVAVVQG